MDELLSVTEMTGNGATAAVIVGFLLGGRLQELLYSFSSHKSAAVCYSIVSSIS